MTILDGRVVAARMEEALTREVQRLAGDGGRPTLAIVMAGEDPAAASYVRAIERRAARVGLGCLVHRLAADADRTEVTRLLHGLSLDPNVNGVVVQTPLPPGLHAAEVGAHIATSKDVDGLNPASAGRLALGLPAFPPATAAAVLELLRHFEVPIAGARAVVIGRSAVVGRPVAALLLAADATVTVCHSKTPGLAEVARQADILVVAAGRARLVGAAFVKPGATVVDVGTNVGPDGVVGDVDAAAVLPVAGGLTPVPGGVGPVTTMTLLRHTVVAATRRSSPQAPA